MRNILFDKKHLREYAGYGITAGLFYVCSLWYFFDRANYKTSPQVIFVGSIFFMFVIMIYALRLTKRRSENYSTWTMIIAGQMAVLVGIVVSVMSIFILYSFYSSAFSNSAGTDQFLHGSERGSNVNANILGLMFATAIFENYGAAAFISFMVAYAIKPDQTQDQTPVIFEEPADSESW